MLTLLLCAVSALSLVAAGLAACLLALLCAMDRDRR